MGYDLVIFGASGAIGKALCQWHITRNVRVTGVSRVIPETRMQNMRWLSWDPSAAPQIFTGLKFDAVIWAQGANANDTARTFDAKLHMDMYEANVLYILKSLRLMFDAQALSQSARFVVISSIWQNIARSNKLSYSITKSALQGLVRSLAIDLGVEGKLVNAVLPGALDTPMTRRNLSAEQIGKLEGMTPLASLPALSDVCNLSGFLCSPENTGITGQFIEADRGFSYAKII